MTDVVRADDPTLKDGDELLLPVFFVRRNSHRLCGHLECGEEGVEAVLMDAPDIGFIYVCPGAELVKGWPEGIE